MTVTDSNLPARAGLPDRRPAVAGPDPGLDRPRRAARAARRPEPVTFYVGLRPDRAEPARRPPHAGHHRPPAAARRAPAAAAGRRRHRPDRRPEGERRAHPQPARGGRRLGASGSATSSRRSSRTPGSNAAQLVNNLDWTGEMSVIEFLRDVGKHFPVNQMLAREVVKARLETGISFTEFSYQLLQAHDFFELHRRHGCQLQFGGSDQWGNITAGVDYVRRRGARPGARVHHPAGHQGRRHQVRQDRGRRRLARPGDDQPVRVLPVLGQRRRPRRRPATCGTSASAPARSSRSWRRRPRSGRRRGSRSGRWPRS